MQALLQKKQKLVNSMIPDLIQTKLKEHEEWLQERLYLDHYIKSPEDSKEDIRRFNDLDMSGLDLSFVTLRGANLINSNLSNSDLSDSNLSKANLRNANFEKANLQRANLSGAKFKKSKFIRADLSSTSIELTTISGDFSFANFSNVKFKLVRFEECCLRNARFNNAILAFSCMQNENLEEVDFTEADLRRTNLSGVDVRSASFRGADLRGVCFKGANLSGADLTGAKLGDNVFLETVLDNVKCSYSYIGNKKVQFSQGEFKEYCEGISNLEEDFSNKFNRVRMSFLRNRMNRRNTSEHNYLVKVFSTPENSKALNPFVRDLNHAVELLEDHIEQKVEYSREGVVESPDWWYIPTIFIGCTGFVVDKKDGYINSLGSVHVPLADSLWAHNIGIKHDAHNLTVTKVNNLDKTINILMELGNKSPVCPRSNKHDNEGNLIEFWKRDDLRAYLMKLPVTFYNQQLWLTIPLLHHASKRKYFEFTVQKTQENI